MKRQADRLLPLTLGMLILVALGLGGLVALLLINPGIATAFLPQDPTPTLFTLPTTMPPSTATATLTATSTATSTAIPDTPTPSPPPYATLSPQMGQVERSVSALRGLVAKQEVPHLYLSGALLAERVEKDFLADYTADEARDEVLMLAALDVLPADFDLYAFYTDLYTEGIAGFYDPERKEFVIIGGSGTFSATDEWVYSHEYTHALQDQHFDLIAFLHYNDDAWHIEHPDEALARRALIEGDAMLTTQLYTFTHMSQERLQELLAESAAAGTTVLDSAPSFLSRSFHFPYTEGLAFVQALYERGGYDLVNQAYADPPTSTEQILHPERYLSRDDAQMLELADDLTVLGGGYREVAVQPLGEFTLQLYLEQKIAGRDAARAAEGWDGGVVAVYHDETRGALVMVSRLIWDTSAEAQEFLAIAAQYGQAWAKGSPSTVSGVLTCWTASDVLCVSRLDADETLVIRAPDQATVETLLGQYVIAP